MRSKLLAEFYQINNQGGKMKLRKHYLIIAAVTIMAACGTTASDSTVDPVTDSSAAAPSGAEQYAESVAGLTGQARIDKLLADAMAAGGKLSIYSGLSDTPKLAEAFTELYGIEVEVYRANSETILQKLLQERDADFSGADLVINDGQGMNLASGEGLFTPYKSEHLALVTPEAIQEFWTASTQYVFTMGWNKDLVLPGEEPTSYEDLADEKWEGKVGLEIGDVDWYAALYTYYTKTKSMSEEDFRTLFKAIGANSQVSKGHTAMVDFMAAGQYAVLPSAYSHGIDKAADKGAPVAWKNAAGKPIEPLVVKFSGFGLIANAKNAAAALLFADFELTGGQDVYKKSFRIGTVDMANSFISGFEIVSVPEADLLARRTFWEEAYSEMIRS
jgi:iron(III) transport system substrate-binding protein